MGCLSHRKKQTDAFVDQKWDYINLTDFKSNGCGPGWAYGFLWFSLIISIAVYGVDTFTAVNLLVFNRWSSQIKPAIPFEVSKWIFSVCILLSFVNLAFEGIRAYRIMKRGNVAECYMDSLAARWECIRLGSGHGWRRFLVFAELTKGKKGGEYIALFTYFRFKCTSRIQFSRIRTFSSPVANRPIACIRVIVCMGPRQVVNALTLKSVYLAKLAVESDNVGASFQGFFEKLKTLAEEDYRQTLILSGMCFTLIVWVFSALYLISAVLFYVFFLFHWLPSADGGLSGYCVRKVNKALLKIVTQKVNKALAKGQTDRWKAAMNGEKEYQHPDASLPTLPNLGPVSTHGDALPPMPMLGRSETAPLPPYSSRPGTPATIEMNALDRIRPLQSRTNTGASVSSYSSRAPLVGAAAAFGYGRTGSPAPSLPDIDLKAPLPRPSTANSQRSLASRPGMGHLNSNSNGIFRQHMTQSPAPTEMGSMRSYGPPMGPPPTSQSTDNYGQPAHYDNFNQQGPPSRQYDSFNRNQQSSPAPSASGFRPPPMTRSATGQFPPGGPSHHPRPLHRNLTGPIPPRGPAGDYFDRSGTPQSNRGGAPPYGYDMEAQPYGRY